VALAAKTPPGVLHCGRMHRDLFALILNARLRMPQETTQETTEE
jgi:hypothetical protein